MECSYCELCSMDAFLLPVFVFLGDTNSTRAIARQNGVTLIGPSRVVVCCSVADCGCCMLLWTHAFTMRACLSLCIIDCLDTPTSHVKSLFEGIPSIILLQCWFG